VREPGAPSRLIINRAIEACREVVFELNENEFGRVLTAGREKEVILDWLTAIKHLVFYVVRKRGLEPLSLLGASS
jgi:hypothetical protein